MGVWYLFMDLASVDQSLSGEALIQQVVLFSSLYSTIPVIAAYNMDGERFDDIMYRPWLFNEARLYRHNPTRIVYVGHNDQGAKHRGELSPIGKPILSVDLWRFQFGTAIGRVWMGSFIKTIIGVLCNRIGMGDVSDLKFIIPPYARIFAAACEKISRGDYLMTAAMLCRVHTPQRDKLWEDARAVWKHKYNMRLDYDWYLFDAFPNVECVIFDALGLGELEWEEFGTQVKARRNCLVMDRRENVPVPKVEIVSVAGYARRKLSDLVIQLQNRLPNTEVR
ncbi:hypothetical protein QBC36DRAFT_308121 [Triangularia setosa]|uniref:Uncharacterized protein n=1 Tax=Triangularia setosa TaxID=2587417 RepID=A0AAN7A9Z1_9PEZI|nr:hypothetical protein QBC36DRAFT_308121 [Podospora setosa]